MSCVSTQTIPQNLTSQVRAQIPHSFWSGELHKYDVCYHFYGLFCGRIPATLLDHNQLCRQPWLFCSTFFSSYWSCQMSQDDTHIISKKIIIIMDACDHFIHIRIYYKIAQQKRQKFWHTTV